MARNNISKFLTFIALILLFILALGFVLYPQKPNKSVQNTPAIFQNPKVFSDIKARFIDVRRIKITIPDGAFQIIKEGENWQVVERSNYPVSMEFLKIFADDISNLEKGGLITNDPALFDKMGVGEPMEFGEGTIVELFDPQDQVISSSHVGKSNNEIYVRRMGDRNIFAAQGRFTDIAIFKNWLDLKIFQINKDEISSILINRNGAPELSFSRDNVGEYKLDEIANPQISQLCENISNPKLYDVAPKSRLSTEKIATIKINFKNGENIQYSLYKQYKAFWIIINPPDEGGKLKDIKQFAPNWAYIIDEEFAKQILQSKSKLKSFIKK